MERSLFCSIDNLQNLRVHGASDWRYRILKNGITTIQVSKKDVSDRIPSASLKDCGNLFDDVNGFLHANIQTKQEFLDLEEGLIIDPSLRSAYLLLSMCQAYGESRVIYAKELYLDNFINGAICNQGYSDDNLSEFEKKGVFVIDTHADKELKSLQRGWYEDPIPDVSKPYSWSHFLGRPLPTSNSVLITDRYLFKADERTNGSFVNCENQLASLLNQIIPEGFNDEYHITFLFEYDQLCDSNLISKYDKLCEQEDKIRKHKEAEIDGMAIHELDEKIKQYKHQREELKKQIKNNAVQHLQNICSAIYYVLNYKKVCFDFIAVRNPNKSYNQPAQRYPREEWKSLKRKWSRLHYHSHDRCIITNYYWIIATGELTISQEDLMTHVEYASRRQHIGLYTLFHGVNNPDQNEDYIPFYAINTYLSDLYEYMRSAPSFSYMCLRYSSEAGKLTEINYPLLKRNHLIA